MPRIDAPLATQVADLVRPAQNGRDVQLQAETARAKTARPDPDEDGALSTATPSADARPPPITGRTRASA